MSYDLLNQDVYSVILETLPIEAINNLRSTNISLTTMINSVRQDNSFWKRRLEVLLNRKITYEPRYSTWYHIYNVLSSKTNDMITKLFKAASYNEIDAVGVILNTYPSIKIYKVLIVNARKKGNTEVVNLLINAAGNT